MKPFKQLAQTLAVAATLLIAQPIQAETFYFHNDHLGTPQVLTDDSGTVVWQGSYKPFGEVTETAATVEQNIRFPGQYFEEETGLHYNYFRDYDPGTGRYIESDPIGLQGGINTFGYVGGNPVLRVDPTGLKTCGSGWSDYIVPDNPLFYGFSEAREEHDECYGTCGASKISCDEGFCGRLLRACYRSGNTGGCIALARLYCFTVETLGEKPYQNAQNSACEGDDCNRNN